MRGRHVLKIQLHAELVAVQVTEGELADETCGLFGDLSGAFDCNQSCSRTGDWRSTRGPHISTTGLFRVSRDPKRTGSLAKLTGADILRACNRAWNDNRCPIRGAYDAACGDANVQVYDRTKRRCYRLHPQPTLAKACLSVPLRQHRQAAGPAARAAANKRGVTRLQPHISRQSAQCPLRPQVRKYRRNALSDVMGQKGTYQLLPKHRQLGKWPQIICARRYQRVVVPPASDA